MNNGKICVPVFAEKADDLITDMKRAAQFADLVELRIDSLRFDEIDPFFEKLQGQSIVPDEQLLVTFRPKEQGGFRDLILQERKEFWCAGYDVGWGADLEEDVMDIGSIYLTENFIASHHDFVRVPDNLPAINQRLKNTYANIVKLAVQIDDISDGLSLWKLLKYAEKGTLIPIAMGEAGKWTRIMGPAFGAPLTYASLETGKENAPGQISVRDMIEVYRVKELTEQTQVYAIIGDPVSKSLSPFMHNAAFKLRCIDAVFMHMEVKDLDPFMREFIPQSGLNFGGFAVTMPHKESIIPYLDEIDDVANAIGAVNTVEFERGKLLGSNTDAHGFIDPLKRVYGDLQGASVAILGAGGAARACAYALNLEGSNTIAFARSQKKAKGFSKGLEIEVRGLTDFISARFDIVINTTPVGMSADSTSLLTSDQLEGVKLVYDLITKPAETPLIREAKKAGIQTLGGVEMLIDQGIRQFEIWTGTDAPADVMREAALDRL